MASVIVLPETVQGRIAAGEVIERPASAVKELVENALDAGASRVEVEIERGGRQRCRVADDGGGMEPEDLALSVERFATSKLRTEKDLLGVRTLGFRGEALPSMSAVAELEITSRPEGFDEAYRLRTEPAGARTGPEPAPGPRGTVVEMRALFARMPARLKFLRSDATEAAAVAQVCQRMALARPDVAFSLRSDGKEVLSAPAGQNLRERAATVLGEAAAGELVEVASGEHGWLAAEGLVAGPGSAGRRDRKLGFIFLNGRFIRDRTIAHAVGSAYQSVIPSGRFPTHVLMLEVDPGQVDVNVHPAKYEVRFRSPGPVHEFVRRSVREALRKAGAQVPVGSHEPPARSGQPQGPHVPARAETRGQGEAGREAGGEAGGARSGAGHGHPAREYDLWGTSGAADVAGFVRPRGGSLVAEAGVGEVEEAQGTAGAAASGHSRRPEGAGPGPTADRDFRIIGRTRKGFIIVETPGDLRIVDPHALHERILYERLSVAGEDGESRAGSQTLLVPETLDLTPDEVPVFERTREPLARLGFVAEPFGGGTVVVRAVPEGVPPTAAGEILREVLSDVEYGGGSQPRPETTAPLEKIRRSLACRSAVRLGSRLAETEIAALVGPATEVPASCPHGRPVAWVITHEEIARRLGR